MIRIKNLNKLDGYMVGRWMVTAGNDIEQSFKLRNLDKAGVLLCTIDSRFPTSLKIEPILNRHPKKFETLISYNDLKTPMSLINFLRGVDQLYE